MDEFETLLLHPMGQFFYSVMKHKVVSIDLLSNKIKFMPHRPHLKSLVSSEM